jgi:hypothetical protein
MRTAKTPKRPPAAPVTTIGPEDLDDLTLLLGKIAARHGDKQTAGSFAVWVRHPDSGRWLWVTADSKDRAVAIAEDVARFIPGVPLVVLPRDTAPSTTCACKG